MNSMECRSYQSLQDVFFDACVGGELNLVALLIKQFSLQDVQEKGLCLSVYNKHHDVVLYLIREKTNVNCQLNEFYRMSPLIIASRFGDYKIVKLLLCIGAARPDLKDVNGDTALTHAAANGHSDIVKLLICDAGADVNHQNSRGYTAVMLALWLGKVEAAKILVNSNADLKIKSVNYENALTLSASANQMESVKFILSMGSKHYGDINHCVPYPCFNEDSSYGSTYTNISALGFATYKKNQDMISLLKNHGACSTVLVTTFISHAKVEDFLKTRLAYI